MKKYLKLIGNVLTLLSLLFIIYAVWKLGLDFSGIDNIPLCIFICIIGILLKTLTVLVSALIWRNWLGFFAGKPADLREALYVYTKANTGKYLPGNVMQYVERNLFADKMGVNQKKIAISSLIEVMSLVLVAFITAMLFSYDQLLLALQSVREALGNRTIYLAVVVIILCLAVFLLICVLLRKKIGGALKEYSLTDFFRHLILGMLGQALVLSVLGLIFVMLYVFMGGKTNGQVVLNIIAGYIISWVLGFVVPGAPGGIGIREMVLTLLVGSVVGKELVLTIALIHRFITIVGDFLAYLLGNAIHRLS